jgi:hypothetical protein
MLTDFSTGAWAKAWTKFICFVCHPCTTVRVSSMRTEFRDVTGEYLWSKCSQCLIWTHPWCVLPCPFCLLSCANVSLLSHLPYCRQHCLVWWTDFRSAVHNSDCHLQIDCQSPLSSFFKPCSVVFSHCLMVVKKGVGIRHRLLCQERFHMIVLIIREIFWRQKSSPGTSSDMLRVATSASNHCINQPGYRLCLSTKPHNFYLRVLICSQGNNILLFGMLVSRCSQH